MLVHFSADLKHSMCYHGSLDVQRVDNTTVGLMYDLYRTKCKEWNINPKDGVLIEIYDNDRNLIHRYEKPQ